MLCSSIIFMYYFVRKERLVYILDTTKNIFKYATDLNIDRMDMTETIRQSKTVTKASVVLLIATVHLFALWPVMSVKEEK